MSTHNEDTYPLEIAQDLIEEIRAHVRSSIRPSREIVGRLVLRDGIAQRYERLRNWARGDGRFRTHGEDRRGLAYGEIAVLVHSHPTNYPRPSSEDISGAHPKWLGQPYGIFVAPLDKLLLFRLHGDRRGFDKLTYEIVQDGWVLDTIQ